MTAAAESPVRLAGDVAIVTGAGRGLGAAHARELASRGARVVVNDLDAGAADGVVAEISATGGVAVASYRSVATERGGEAIVEEALSEFGSLEIVVNNAGLRSSGYLGSLSTEQIDTVLDSHLRAAFFVTQPAWHVMCSKGYGRIVLTGSAAGLLSCQGLSNYAAAKAGLYGLMKAMAYEGMPSGIQANCVLPWTKTSAPGQPARVLGYEDELRRYVDTDELRAIPSWRTDPRLTSFLVAALVSRSCDVTGEAFSVCFGRFARVFVGIGHGWIAPEPDAVDADVVLGKLASIRQIDDFVEPRWLYDELAGVVDRVRDPNGERRPSKKAGLPNV